MLIHHATPRGTDRITRDRGDTRPRDNHHFRIWDRIAIGPHSSETGEPKQLGIALGGIPFTVLTLPSSLPRNR